MGRKSPASPFLGARFFWGIFLLLSLDRLTKWAALTSWADHPLELFPGVRFLLLVNRGIAFSLPLGDLWLIISTVFVFLFVTLLFFRMLMRGDHAHAKWLLLLLLGAASNIIDRLFYGGVIDVLEIGFLPVLNVADLMILFALLAIMLQDFRRTKS